MMTENDEKQGNGRERAVARPYPASLKNLSNKHSKR